jgi:hypothetical protein
MAYGSTNMYRPENKSRASGGSGEYVIQGGGVPCDKATKLAMTVTVKAMDSQRWVCRIQWFQFNGVSSEHEPEVDRIVLDCGYYEKTQ